MLFGLNLNCNRREFVKVMLAVDHRSVGIHQQLDRHLKLYQGRVIWDFHAVIV